MCLPGHKLRPTPLPSFLGSCPVVSVCLSGPMCFTRSVTVDASGRGSWGYIQSLSYCRAILSERVTLARCFLRTHDSTAHLSPNLALSPYREDTHVLCSSPPPILRGKTLRPGFAAVFHHIGVEAAAPAPDSDPLKKHRLPNNFFLTGSIRKTPPTLTISF